MVEIIDLITDLMEYEVVEMLVKLVLISVLAGIIGYEREAWRKPAGFRTYILVGISSVLVVAAGEYTFENLGGDPSRIPAQLLSGIGFLGAGTILRDGTNIKGLTTAAGLLSVTAIGLVVGTGAYLIAIIATLIVLAIISHSHLLSDRLEHILSCEVKVVSKNAKKNLEKIRKITAAERIDITSVRYEDVDDVMKEIYLEFKAKDDVDLNNIYLKISALEEVDEVVELKNSKSILN